MQRLLTVSSTYLKFTFACMLAGTAVFSLTGLAMTSPKIFLLVIAVAVAAFFIVRGTARRKAITTRLTEPLDFKRPSLIHCETGSKVGFAATPFCVTSTSNSPEDALLGTWKSIW